MRMLKSQTLPTPAFLEYEKRREALQKEVDEDTKAREAKEKQHKLDETHKDTNGLKSSDVHGEGKKSKKDKKDKKEKKEKKEKQNHAPIAHLARIPTPQQSSGTTGRPAEHPEDEKRKIEAALLKIAKGTAAPANKVEVETDLKGQTNEKEPAMQPVVKENEKVEVPQVQEQEKTTPPKDTGAEKKEKKDKKDKKDKKEKNGHKEKKNDAASVEAAVLEKKRKDLPGEHPEDLKRKKAAETAKTAKDTAAPANKVEVKQDLKGQTNEKETAMQPVVKENEKVEVPQVQEQEKTTPPKDTGAEKKEKKDKKDKKDKKEKNGHKEKTNDAASVEAAVLEKKRKDLPGEHPEDLKRKKAAETAKTAKDTAAPANKVEVKQDLKGQTNEKETAMQPVVKENEKVKVPQVQEQEKTTPPKDTGAEKKEKKDKKDKKDKKEKNGHKEKKNDAASVEAAVLEKKRKDLPGEHPEDLKRKKDAETAKTTTSTAAPWDKVEVKTEVKTEAVEQVEVPRVQEQDETPPPPPKDAGDEKKDKKHKKDKKDKKDKDDKNSDNKANLLKGNSQVGG